MNLSIESAKKSKTPTSGALVSERHYRRMLWMSVLSVSLVAVIPLVIMTVINYYQYQEALHVESIRPIARLTANVKLTLESYLSERLSALSFVSRSEPNNGLRTQIRLNQLLTHLKRAFGGFVDLGLIDEKGSQVAYAGPFELAGKNYAEHDWFHEVTQRGVHISDVFLGHRNSPHFVIAVSHDTHEGHIFVLRATIDADDILRKLELLVGQHSQDAFLINREGVLQTPSQLYGKVLEKLPFPVPKESSNPEVLETQDENDAALILGYAYIERSPFVAMLLHHPSKMREGWASLRSDLLLFLGISILLILGVVFWGSAYMTNRARESDMRRASLYHKMEYTNKMAAIGRLAAGVAHEINNPLAIVNEKAGLLKDLLSMSKELPPKEKLIGLVDSVLASVDRCGGITHRLLGFARHMDVETEEIDLELLIKAVLTFLEKEASYRNLSVSVHADDDVPTIKSDRGQLQQVFLNIVNNAFAAVDQGGVVRITIENIADNQVSVAIADNGMGISKENLEHIFEPFFTTKKGAGTGLGLSITYGIIQKLRGKIDVSSTLGQGTCFTITLPEERT
jgi:two-component system NtrC family sensor kinase